MKGKTINIRDLKIIWPNVGSGKDENGISQYKSIRHVLNENGHNFDSLEGYTLGRVADLIENLPEGYYEGTAIEKVFEYRNGGKDYIFTKEVMERSSEKGSSIVISRQNGDLILVEGYHRTLGLLISGTKKLKIDNIFVRFYEKFEKVEWIEMYGQE